jgi:hypothetical protein
MPESSPDKTRRNPPTPPSSAKLNVISNWLEKLLDRFPDKGKITESETEDWFHDLRPFSLEAVEFAFETWRRSGLFFPKNGQILDLCLSYQSPETSNARVISNSPCDENCRSHHGRGYFDSDMLWVYGQAMKIYKAGGRPNYGALLTELDHVRPEGPPEWRR